MQGDALQDLIKRYGIALTGGVATGKSTVAAMLRQASYVVIDADQLARGVTAKSTAGLTEIIKHFGNSVLTPDGALDRQRLGAIVFNDPDKRRALEAITHPLIRSALGDALVDAGIAHQPRPFFYEAALIFESGADKDFRQVWVTVCPPALQRTRLMHRSGLTEENANRIIASQMAAADKAARGHVVINTDIPLAELETSVKELLAKVPH